MNCIRFVASLVLLASAAAQAQSPCAHSTPFRYVNHRIIVPVLVSGHGPYNFLLDTGTQVTLIDPTLSSTLHIKNKDGAVVLGGMGLKASATKQQVDSIELDSHKVAALTVVMYDLTKLQDSSDTRIMGILGQNFLEQFNIVIYNKTSCVKLFDTYNP
jgi:hypothetical protein